MTFGSLFAGIGGFDLGFERAGLECRWQCEIDPFCQKVLAKHWPTVKRYGDIKEVDWNEVERVDVVCGGFPCQPVSVAGKQLAQSDERWLWTEFARCLSALRPRFAVMENTPGLLSANGGSAMGDVLGDLALLGYDAEWEVLPAHWFGPPQRRERVWIVAHRDRIGTDSDRVWIGKCPEGLREGFECHPLLLLPAIAGGPTPTDSRRLRVADGFSEGLDRVGALGNAVIPQIPQWIGERLMQVAQGGERT